MQYDCHVTMEMQQTHCHATVPVALLWKCYKDLTCHNTLPTTNPTRTVPGANPGLCGEKPVTNGLSLFWLSGYNNCTFPLVEGREVLISRTSSGVEKLDHTSLVSCRITEIGTNTCNSDCVIASN
jgi:hypothetical protein